MATSFAAPSAAAHAGDGGEMALMYAPARKRVSIAAALAAPLGLLSAGFAVLMLLDTGPGAADILRWLHDIRISSATAAAVTPAIVLACILAPAVAGVGLAWKGAASKLAGDDLARASFVLNAVLILVVTPHVYRHAQVAQPTATVRHACAARMEAAITEGSPEEVLATHIEEDRPDHFW